MDRPARKKLSKKIIIAAVVITLILGVVLLSGGSAAPAGMAGMGMMSAGMGGMMPGSGGFPGGGMPPGMSMPKMAGMGMSSMLMNGAPLLLMSGGLILKAGRKGLGHTRKHKAPQAAQDAGASSGDTEVKAELVNESDPLLKKVRWCETQLFGRTFDSLKMTVRLQNLNEQLVGQHSSGLEFQNSVNSMLHQIDSMHGSNSSGQ